METRLKEGFQKLRCKKILIICEYSGVKSIACSG